jgi:hypothetical protein
MLHHISIAVNQPQQVAEVMAEIFQGQAMPFPPHPGSYMVLAMDEFGTLIEFYPMGTVLVPELNQGQVGFETTSQLATYTSFHAAISVPISLEEIERIADRAGWPIYVCSRDGLFDVVELWVENRLMLELLTPTMAEKYLQLFHPDQLEANLRQLALTNS